MWKQFYPTIYADSAYSVDFQQLYDKGYRGLLTDIDNTLVCHGAPVDERSYAFFCDLKNIGWNVCIISNNSEDRVKPFAEAVGAFYISSAGKPGTSGYQKGMEMMGTDCKNTLFLGDQLFTDIWGANRSGILSILVKPIKLDYKPLILMKRAGEAIVKQFYFRYAKKHPFSL